MVSSETSNAWGLSIVHVKYLTKMDYLRGDTHNVISELPSASMILRETASHSDVDSEVRISTTFSLQAQKDGLKTSLMN